MSQSTYSGRKGLTRDYSHDNEADSPSNFGDVSPMLARRLAAGTSKCYNRPSSPHKFEMASSSGVKLAQEIHDEFLVCKICLEQYKNPKSLNCLHTFCENCIENHVMSESTYKKYSDYREFTCPLCRKRTQLPIGGVKKLPDNFLVSSLSEVVTRQKPSKFPFCDICKMVNRKHREAQSKCLDCAKLLCKQCVDLHKETKVTSSHNLFDVEIEKDIECKEHEDEVVRFYCEPCETCICVLCTFNEHKDHEITQFAEAVEKYKENIQQLLDQCKTKINKFDGQLEDLNKCEDIIKDAENKIHEAAIQYIADIRNQEKRLIEELSNMYGKDTMDYIENKKDLAVQVDGLRSTCNLTEVILKGKDIELLLLKKDVQDKLSTLNDVDIKNLPTTISKEVNFVQGTVDLGFIQDHDRPLLSKLRRRGFGSQDSGMPWPDYTTSSTQTENDSSDDETSDEDTDSESESDSEDEKPTFSDIGIQTESVPAVETSSEEESDDEPPREMREQGTSTDEILTEEKAVNTRSRSLQSLSSQRKSPSKDDPNDQSLAARRRRRRERAQTTNLGQYSHSFDETTKSPDSYGENNTMSSYTDRQNYRRSRFLYNNSGDHDEFYDAESHNA